MATNTIVAVIGSLVIIIATILARRYLRRLYRMDIPLADQRAPGEAFCFDCPDHEACASGYPCSIVKSTNRRKTS